MQPSRFADNLIALSFALLTVSLLAKSTDILRAPAKLSPASQTMLAKLRIHQGASAAEVKLPYSAH